MIGLPRDWEVEYAKRLGSITPVYPRPLRSDSMRKTTADEKEIRRWAAARSAHPVERAPFMQDGEPAMLGFVFGKPPQAEEHLQPITWERFFAVFRLLGLVLAYDGDSQYELLRTDDHHFGSFEGKPVQA